MIVQDVISREVKGVWGNPPQEGATLTPVIKTNNMSYEGYISFDDLTYRDIPVKKLHASFLQKGDLLIEKSGGTKTHSVGYVNIFENENDTYVCNNFIFAIRPDVNIILPKYLFFQLKYMYETGQFSDCYNKTTGIQNLKTDRYLAKSIKCPTKSDQQKIISALDNIEQGIKVKEEQLKILDELIQSRFVEMFETLKEPDIKSWNEVFITKTGKLNANAMDENGKYPFFTCSKEIFHINSFAFDQEALLLAGNNATAHYDVKYYNGKFNAYQRTYVLTLKNPKDKYKVFQYQLVNKLELLKHNSKGSNTRYLTLDILSKLKFITPPLPLQNQFAEFVQQVEKAKEIVKIQIKDLQELLALKMDEYFK